MKVNINNKYQVVFPNLEVKELPLKDLLTDKNILFFYPKDNTP
jgi:peroxiredoxin